MSTRITLPLRIALAVGAITVAASAVVACAQHGMMIMTTPTLAGDRAPAPGEMRLLLRPVLQNGRTADVPPRVVFVRPVPADEPTPAER